MTLLSEIQAAQSQLLLPFINKQLLVRSPLSVIQLFNPNHYNLWQFDSGNYGDSSDYVYLRLFPGYESTNEVQGDRGFKPSFNGTVAQHTTTRRIFTATVRQQTAFIFYIIERLALIANTSSYTTYTPIKIVDFCSPEAIDDVNTSVYNGETGTIRYGRIDIEKRPAIARGFQMDYCLTNWELKFSEVDLRP
ncbi:MAG: hypothetical protein V7L23_31630 [Nostoc sp.]|uniref:hypothetical protein n=1 Tax=Nostoc sp. TaxID=1180 RepID=UPI002FF34A1D